MRNGCGEYRLRASSALKLVPKYPSQSSKLCSLGKAAGAQNRALCKHGQSSFPQSRAPLETSSYVPGGWAVPPGVGQARRVAESEFGDLIAEQNNLTAAASCRFGLPFVLHLERTIAWDILQKEILEKMQYFLRPAACLQVSPRVPLS